MRPLFLVLASAALCAQQLHPARTVIGQISSAAPQSYSIRLKSGQFAQVVLWQPRFPVVLRLRAADRIEPLIELDLPGSADDPERVAWIAERTAEYRLELAAAGQQPDRAPYRIRFERPRRAVAADEKRVAAQKIYAEARSFGSKKDYAHAIEAWEKALSPYREAGDKEREAVVLAAIGAAQTNLGRSDLAIKYYGQALPIFREIHDPRAEGEALNGLGDAYYRTAQNDKAIELHQRALRIFRKSKDRRNQAESLNDLGNAELTSDTIAARRCYEQALPIRRALGDRLGEARALNNLANIYRRTGETEKALEYYDRSHVIAAGLKERRIEAGTLLNWATMADALDRHQESVAGLEQVLAISREIKERSLEGAALAALGWSYMGLAEYGKVIEIEQQALPILREARDRANEGMAQLNMGVASVYLTRFEDAIDYFNRGLAILQEIKARSETASALTNLGWAYDTLGQFEKAIGYYQQSLSLQRQMMDRDWEGRTLVSMGSSYASLGQYENAIGFLQQALKIFREVKNRGFEAISLKELAIVYQDMKQYDTALKLDQEALTIRREIKDVPGESESLKLLATDYLGLHQTETSIRYGGEALAVARELKSRGAEVDPLNDLMTAWTAAGNPRLAIFYGKQAVNALQSIRADMRGLDADVQKSYVKKYEALYHTLAESLVSLGRLAEAEQVLGLLKEEEYFEYLRRDASEASTLDKRADLTPEEAEWDKRYREIGARLMAIGQERGQLLAKKTRSPEETHRLTELEQDLTAGNYAFEKFLGELTRNFSAKPERVEQIRESQGIMEDLRELPPGTVAIYTLVGAEKFHSILRTADAEKAYEYPIPAADLNRKVLEFRQAAMDPTVDPRPLAQELYKILVAGMADDLRQAKAQTLMWSLDGVLRYLPIAALYDGREYLIEQYRISVMTLASNSRLKDRPDREWTAAEFGVTKAYGENQALPAVAEELNGIAAILHGEVKLDDQFTEAGMRNTLLEHRPVVHIASHFRFQPGDQSQSFLLLGDGGHLSLAELKRLPNLFGGVQLLTLSACNTGMGDGSEVEGFGTLAQRQGAKAVIASLWAVADTSTSGLMQEFYRIREASPESTKLEALREAQLKFLRGEQAAGMVEIPDRGVNVRSHGGTFQGRGTYAHPYYWAPFFLMGNWL